MRHAEMPQQGLAPMATRQFERPPPLQASSNQQIMYSTSWGCHSRSRIGSDGRPLRVWRVGRPQPMVKGDRWASTPCWTLQQLHRAPVPDMRQTMSTLSLPSLQNGQECAQPPSEELPKELTDLDYARAEELFSIFDSRKEGCLDKKQFCRLVMNVCGNSGKPITKNQAEHLFSTVDTNKSGLVDPDEFLGWLFRTPSNFAAGIRNRLSCMDSGDAVGFVEKLDKRRGATVPRGCLDKRRLFAMLSTLVPAAGLDIAASEKLFQFVKNDFLAWLHPDRETWELLISDKERKRIWASKLAAPDPSSHSQDDTAQRQMSKTSVSSLSPSLEAERAAERTALFEMPPGRQVQVHVTIGGRDLEKGEFIYKCMQRDSRRQWPRLLKFTKEIDPHNTGIEKVVLLVGSGIVLWDRTSMLMRMDVEDPFKDQIKAIDWLTQILQDRMPPNTRNTDIASSRGGSQAASKAPGSKSVSGSKSEVKLPWVRIQ
eukprot:TRINITY_DN8391_c0_g1_i2.p1 TRINITY_DN8391_c0_g1~~TRINITY_DN8391_c0_g1_i2.p1  ORF type:complete len:484 (-),score=61.45 TRINITY_DN8391_c0_g1_i2:417-1868(-)